MQADIINDALVKIYHYEQKGRKEVILSPISNLLNNVIGVFQSQHYVGEIEKIEDGRGGKLKVQLLGRINKTAVIKPRFPVKAPHIVDYEKKFLPAVGFGVLIISTPEGVMSHIDATEKHIGGRLLAYVY